jgi:(1->4)-alpha-D-glucan 1-alpha-D-glucosylmutase
MLATSTHDTKRSEDVRARINVLSERPGTWRKLLARWGRMNRGRKREIDGRAAPGPNQEYLLYQTLIGTWPLEPMDEAALTAYRERIEVYMLKAAREAKTRTSWSDASAEYEDALLQFVRAVLEPREGNLFIADMRGLQAQIARFGLLSSLSQTICKLTAPGVPDVYQGNELWDFSLVDPDNRRPVDYERRRRMLEGLRASPLAPTALARTLVDTLADGRAKLFLTWRALEFRRAHPSLFDEGTYLPVHASGSEASHVVSYARRLGDDAAIVIAPRLHARLLGEREAPPLGPQVWADTVVELPARLRVTALRNAFDGEPVSVREIDGSRCVALGEALANFPVALLSATLTAPTRGPDHAPA